MGESTRGVPPRIWRLVVVLALMSMAAFAASSLREARARSLQRRAELTSASGAAPAFVSRGFTPPGPWADLPRMSRTHYPRFWVPDPSRRLPSRDDTGTRRRAGQKGRPTDRRVPPAWRNRGGAGFPDPPRIVAGLTNPSRDKGHRGMWRGPASCGEWP
jgi:hypothetical protein